ncbi:MAG: nucleotide sugar dehydrogenase [Candidatus Altiarchaeota archaeon]|nr:nucleotide sugar dehydrogenase [Candidatus Altiarchaeota archaeon]
MKIHGLSSEQAADLLRGGELCIAVYGLGKMGLPLASVLADSGARVVGADINRGVVDSINKGVNHIREEPGLDELVTVNVEAGRLTATANLPSAAKQADIHVILVPTLIKEGKADLSIVRSVVGDIASGLEAGDIVITECTMPPGSTESLIPPLESSGLKAGLDFGLAHCPERTMTGTALRDIRGEYPKIIGCVDEKTAQPVSGVYSVINSGGVIPVSDIKTAECVKVFEGVYRDVNIALANELAMVCEKLSVDALEVFDTANTQPYCHLHRPGAVGGHCIPFYPLFVMDSDTDLLRTARELNDSVTLKLVNEAAHLLGELNQSLDGARVLVLGLSFRGGVKESIKSMSLDLFRLLSERGALVSCMDPLYSRDEIESFGVSFREDFAGIDCVIIATDHDEFSSLNWAAIKGVLSHPVVVDGRQMVDPPDLRSLGFLVYSLGHRK